MEKRCGQGLQRSVVEKCCGEVLRRSVVVVWYFFCGVFFLVLCFCGCVRLCFYIEFWACFCFCLVEKCWGGVGEECWREVL